MDILCTDKVCINIDEEVGTEEWKRQIYENYISESDKKKLEEFINMIHSI